MSAINLPFFSVAALRTAHGDLLKKCRMVTGTDTNTTALPRDLIEEVILFIGQGRRTGAIIDQEEERWNTQSILDYWTTVLYRGGYESPEATLVDFDPANAPALPEASCPYVGLEAFQEDKGALFYGRQNLIDEMLARLAEGKRLLAVLGPSGSGKSSVVLAGLIPALKSGNRADSADWSYYPPMVPGSDPLANLLQTIAGIIPGDPDYQRQYQLLKDDSQQLLRIVEARKPAPALIVVDQFEEVFTLCRNDELMHAFEEQLLALITEGQYRHTLVITLRSDFDPRMTLLKRLYPYYDKARYPVTPLSAGSLREAIEQPAAAAGLKFEEGVVDELVKGLLGEPAGLPLLQVSLLSLWKKRQRNRITLKAYREIGGARDALTLSADSFYDNLIPQDRETVRRILLRLVQTSEGLEVFRNRIRRNMLYRSGEAQDQVDRVLDKLIAARLVKLTKGETEKDDQVEVAHEALIRNWRRMVQWLDEDRVMLRQRLRLTAAAEQWKLHEKDPGGLFGGTLLQEASQYDDLNDLEVEFLAESHKAFEFEKQKEKNARLKAIRTNRILTGLAIGLAILGIISARATFIARTQTNFANMQTNIANMQTKLADSEKAKAVAASTMAYNQEIEARRQKEAADSLRKKAEIQKDSAQFLKKLADQQKAIAEKARDSAQTERLKAIDEAKKAQHERNVAIELNKTIQQKNIEAESLKISNTTLYPIKSENDISSILRKKSRPIIYPGSSIGVGNNTGSLCCVVRDKSGKKYLLSLGYIFSGDPGTEIIQPGIGDAGNKRDVVAQISRRSSTLQRPTAGVLAECSPGVSASDSLLGFGRIRGILTNPKVGQKVYLVGRGSGLSAGEILAIKDGNGDIVTTRISSVGDGGAPVVSAEGMLIGILWGSDGKNSLVTPILPVLQELNVELSY